MDETMVKRWNEVVGDQDRVYHLGDVAINRRSLSILYRLKGRKCLIKGNHDIFKLKDYLPHFDDIRAYRHYPHEGIVCSHIPVHTNQLEGRFDFNVHGHTHQNFVEKSPHHPDERYVNVCVEQTDYRPINFEEVLKRCKL